MRRSTAAVLLFFALPLCGATDGERAVAQSRLNALVSSLATGTLATTGSAGDANGDGNVTVADIFYLINFLFTSGPPPVAQAIGDLAGEVTGPPSATVVSNAVATNTANAIVRRDAGGSFSAGSVTLAGALALPATASSSVGVITMGGSVFAHDIGVANTFLGTNAGNFALTGNGNTAVGNTAMINAGSGSRNTAIGNGALFSNTDGDSNTAVGAGALASNTIANYNTAIGDQALFNDIDGNFNTAIGQQALFKNSNGYQNTAIGQSALFNNTTGFQNTAIGDRALIENTTGFRNIAIGEGAGQLLTTGIDNIDIGNNGDATDSATIRIGRAGAQTSAFIAGITAVGVTGAPVIVSSLGQLGVASSSRRYKSDISDMGSTTDGLMRLRPVTFRYIAHGPDGSLQYGLVAEEVAEVYPELVTHDKDGQVETVMYQFLAPMLLNEVQKQHQTIAEQQRELDDLRSQLAALEARLNR